MNERIRELKKQAWEYTMAVHDGHIVPPLNKEVWPVDKVFDEKFAELIVAECMKVVINGKYSATECERNTHRIAHNNARDEASSDIKKHFGVEE